MKFKEWTKTSTTPHLLKHRTRKLKELKRLTSKATKLMDELDAITDEIEERGKK